MALGLTKVRDGEDVWGRTRVALFDVALDTSYPLTNGYTINASDVGLKHIESAEVVGGNKASGALLYKLETGSAGDGVPLDHVILRVYFPTGGTAPSTLIAPVAGEGAITNGAISIAASTATPASGSTPVTSTSAQPAIPITFGAITQASSTIAAGSLTGGVAVEVANTTDVSSLKIRVRFLGQ